MRKAFIAALLMSAGSLVVPAYADSTHECQGRADCSTTTINNNGDTINKGGQGGDGGTGIGIAGAAAGAQATNNNQINAQGGKGGEANAGAISGSLSNAENNNHNIAKGGEGTGIGISGAAANAENNNHNIAKGGTANAGAISGSLSSSENHNNNIAKGGEANAGAVSGSVSGAKVDNDVRNTNKQGQHQSSESNSSSSATSSSDNANNASQSVNFEAQERAPVNTAYAAPLVSGEDTCMGSSSIGGQGVGFGISIGTTWTDENCQRLKNSRQLAAMGFRRASVALLCVNDDVARAMEAAGLPCRVTNGDEWTLTTVALPADPAFYAPPAPRVVYSTVVEDRPHYTPKKKKRPAKKNRCRMVRQCR